MLSSYRKNSTLYLLIPWQHGTLKCKIEKKKQVFLSIWQRKNATFRFHKVWQNDGFLRFIAHFYSNYTEGHANKPLNLSYDLKELDKLHRIKVMPLGKLEPLFGQLGWDCGLPLRAIHHDSGGDYETPRSFVVAMNFLPPTQRCGWKNLI